MVYPPNLSILKSPPNTNTITSHHLGEREDSKIERFTDAPLLSDPPTTKIDDCKSKEWKFNYSFAVLSKAVGSQQLLL